MSYQQGIRQTKMVLHSFALSNEAMMLSLPFSLSQVIRSQLHAK